MRLSWKWLAEFVDLTPLKNAQGLADLLTSRGLEVEGFEAQAQGLDRVVSVQILEKKPHPQADRLSLCSVSLGSGEPLAIVCGAQNMKAGDRVALAQIGAHLPNDLKITQSKIRGEISNGMLCSETELKLSTESAGILILPPDTPLGRPLAEILGRDDVILTLKATANRGDAISHYGVAREIAAALGQEVRLPKLWSGKPTGAQKVSVRLDAGDLVPQFCGAVVQGVRVGPSPAWLVARLEALGHRTINNIVDASNLVMLELGQPTHAYDLAEVRGSQIIARKARPGESLPLLNGQTLELTGEEVVIADAERAIGLGGIMGGGNSEVTLTTQNLYLEDAEFQPAMVRRISSRTQIKTDAAYHFERGVDPEGQRRAQARLIQLVLELAGGSVAEVTHTEVPGRKVQSAPILFEDTYLNDFLGIQVQSEQVKTILEGLNCRVEKAGSGWSVTPPSYRLDLKLKQDIAEEIARTVGYDQIPATIPPLSGAPVFSGSSAGAGALMDRAKDFMKDRGLHEAVNLAFTSEKWLDQFKLKSQALLINPLSEECKAMVPSLLPGLIRNAMDNWNHYFGSDALAIRLFELRPVFSVAGILEAHGHPTAPMETGVKESLKLSFLLTGPRMAETLKSEKTDLDFYDLKAIVEQLGTTLGTKGLRFQALSDIKDTVQNPDPIFGLFHPGQSAVVLAGKQRAGVFGLLHPALAQQLKLKAPLWIAELDWNAWMQVSRAATETPAFRPWPAFPTMERDYALVVKSDLPVEKICQLALKIGKPLVRSAKVFDIYRGAQVSEGMTSVAVRVIFYHEDRTLQENEVEAVSAQIVGGWKKELGADLRG